MLKKDYFGGFFLTPVPHERYQNTSGFASELLFFLSSMFYIRHFRSFSF